MKVLSTHLGLTVLGVLLTVGRLPADPVAWSYDWSRTPQVVNPDGSGTGGITLGLTTGGGHATDNADIVATILSTFGDAAIGTPDSYTNRPYSLTLHLTDDVLHASGMLTFTGMFSGTVTATTAAITNVFEGPTAQTLTLGNHRFRVTMGQYFAPGGPGGATGSIHAGVQVQTLSQSGGGQGQGNGQGSQQHNSPEPTCLVLCGIGLSCVSVAYWRRHQRRNHVAVPDLN
jgi:hypothetical protein